MKQFRLKKEAVEFFNERYATSIYPFDVWEKQGIDMNALDEVKNVIIKYGQSDSERSSHLSGWDEKGSRFYFTIVFPSTKFGEHDKFSGGKSVRELMDKIQRQVSSHYVDFINQE